MSPSQIVVGKRIYISQVQNPSYLKRGTIITAYHSFDELGSFIIRWDNGQVSALWHREDALALSELP